MDEISEEELKKYVKQFLKELKDLIYEKGLIVWNLGRNRISLLELGLTIVQRKEIILSLSVEDYSSGPVKDKNYPGDYWVFGKQVGSVEIYIKLKIAGEAGEEHAICYSFHEAERPLQYPFIKKTN